MMRYLSFLYMVLFASVPIFCINIKKVETDINNTIRINENYNDKSIEDLTIDLSDDDIYDEIGLFDECLLYSINRSPVYPNDESDSFGNAETISYNVAYDRMYNEYYDYDYFTIAITNDGLYSFYIDIQSTLIIYERYLSGSNSEKKEIMRYNPIDSSDAIFLMGNYEYYFILRPNVVYAGAYCFELSYLTNDFTNYFLKTNYINGSLNNMEVIYRDYSLQSNSGLRIGYVPATCDIEIHNVEKASAYNRHYFGFSDDRIYDVNHFISINYEDDDRYITRTSDYPGMCVVYLNSECLSGDPEDIEDNIGGSGFLVASNAIMTAAHVVTSKATNGKNYMKGTKFFIKPFMTSSNGPQGVVSFYAQTMYYPLSYYTQTVQKENDWCIIVFDGDVEETYGYLGLSFGNDSVINLYCMGYPALQFNYATSYQYKIQLTYSSGNFTPTNNLYISNEVDISYGNSGGPCFYESNGLYYVRCIVSSDYGNYVAYSKINKINYNLLMEAIS